jgi:S1-C subfamily serine protease
MKAAIGCLGVLALLVLVVAVGVAVLFDGSSSDSSPGLFFAGEPTDYAYLGGKYVRIPAAAASELNLIAGAEVVSKGHRSDTGDPSLAAQAGLHVANGSRRLNGHIYPIGGDVITAVNDRKITSYGELRAAIRTKKPYETVTITYFRPSFTRPGTSHTVQVELGYGGTDYSYELP